MDKEENLIRLNKKLFDVMINDKDSDEAKKRLIKKIAFCFRINEI